MTIYAWREDREQVGPFKASAIGRHCFCQRATYWEQRLGGARRTKDPRRELGKRLHEEVLSDEEACCRRLSVEGVRRVRREASVYGSRWYGRVDLVLECEGGVDVLVEIKRGWQQHRHGRLQLGAYMEAWREEHKRRTRVEGILWEVGERGEDRITRDEEGGQREELDGVYEELSRLTTGCEFPETHAPASACKACEFIAMCGDDLWKEREEEGEEEPILYRTYIF